MSDKTTGDATEGGMWMTDSKGVKTFLPFINKHKKISAKCKKIMDDFRKFQLLQHSKKPSSEWSYGKPGSDRTKLWTKTKKVLNGCGIGIPCGKINGMMVVDLDDYKWGDDHPFIVRFGRDYAKTFPTYIQKSAKGGVHLFFQYDERFWNANSDPLGIDFLSDRNQYGDYAGKYVVGAGSVVRYSKKDKEKYPHLEGDMGTYVVLQDKPVMKMPADLEEWIFNHYYPKEAVKAKKQRKQRAVAVSNEINYFKYDISDEKLYSVFAKCFKAHPEYWNQYDRYIVTLTALKSVGGWALFRDRLFPDFNGKDGLKQRIWSKQSDHWNGIKKAFEYNCFNHMLLLIDERTLLDYVKYKPIYEPEMKIESTINRRKLGKDKENPDDTGFVKIRKKVDYAIRSGTGTGKTTLIKEYLEQTGCPFISITSRMTLAEEQYRTFEEAGLDCIYYRHYQGEMVPRRENVMIQIDSIMKLSHYCEYDSWEKEPAIIGNYVLFLDEYASLVEHLVTSPTMEKSRALCFKVFCKIISGAKQVICVDADLNSYTLQILKMCGRDPVVIDNTFQHNKGVPAQEYYQLLPFVEELKSKDKFLFCCDTASGGKAIWEEHFCKEQIEHTDENMIEINGQEINKYSISVGKDDKGLVVFVSAENDFIPELDKWDRVIFSPKIVYGLDSTMKRDVFTMNKEFSISPRGIHQQVARCRNIIKLHYIFFNKTFTEPSFIDIPEVEAKHRRLCDLTTWKEICTREQVECYMKLLDVMVYNNDCYNTNKFCHFKLIMRQRGFIDNESSKKYQTAQKELGELVKKSKANAYDNFEPGNPKYTKLNEYLKIPTEEMANHKELFVETNRLEQYFNLRSYLMNKGTDLEKRLEEHEEFKINKMKSKEYKVIFLTQILKQIGAKSKIDVACQKPMTELESKVIYEKMDELFRFRFDAWKPDVFTTKLGCDEVIAKAMVKLFGSGYQEPYVPTEAQIATGNTQKKWTITKLFDTKRVQIDKVRYQSRKMNPKCIAKYHKLMKYCYPKLFDFEKMDWDFEKDAKDNMPLECYIDFEHGIDEL